MSRIILAVVLTAVGLATSQDMTTVPMLTNNLALPDNGFTNQNNIEFTATGAKTGFTKISCKLDQQGASTCQPKQVYTGLQDDTHTLVVQFKKLDGSLDTVSRTFTWTVDTKPPTLVFTTFPFTAARPKTNQRTITFFFALQSTQDNLGGIQFHCTLKRADATTPVSQNCNTKSITYSNLGAPNDDIAYNFTVTAVDQAQNSKTLRSDFAIDTKLPVVWLPPLGGSFLTQPPRYTNKTAATFSFSTDEPGQVDFRCRRDSAGIFTNCPAKPYTGLAQGEHSLQIQVQDWAGNIQTVMNVQRPINYTNSFGVNSTTSIFQWRVDTTPPPKPQIPSKPPLQTNSRMPMFSFTVAGSQIGGLSYSCQLALPRALPVDFHCFPTTLVASKASPLQAVGAAGLLEGPYTLQVNAIDAAGNYGTKNSYAFTVDLQAPYVKLDRTSPVTADNGINNSPSMTFVFHAIDNFPERTDAIGSFVTITRDPCPLYNCTMVCSLDSAPLTPCTSPITYTALTVANRVEGHTFRVVAMDNATNIGNGSNELRYAWTIDRIPPVTTFVSTPPKAIAIDTSTFTWRTAEPASTPPSFQCSLDNGPYYNCTTAPVGGVYSWTLTGLTHLFNHQFDVIATDYYGNPAAPIRYNWQVDLHPPLVTFNPATWATQGVRLGNPIVLPNNSYSNIVFADFVFSTEPGSTMECQEDDKAWVSCVSPYRFALNIDGTHSFRVRATDPVGHKTIPDNQPFWMWITDTVGPTVTYQAKPARYTNRLNATFTASSNEARSSYQCEYESTQFQSGSTSWLPCLNPPFNGALKNNVLTVVLVQYAFSQTGTQINFVGDHSFLVRAVDQAGNVGAATKWTFNVDLTAPDVIIAATEQVQPEVYSADFRWSKFDYATFKFQASEPVTYACSVMPNISWVNPIPCNAPSLRINNIYKFGQYTFTVNVTDRAGNFDATKSSKSFTWTADPIQPVTKVVDGPNYYINRLTDLKFQISTPVPRLRAVCSIDRLYNNRSVWLAGDWIPCIQMSQTLAGPDTITFTTAVTDLVNITTAIPDGVYNFNVRTIDVFNRTSPSASFEFVVDTIPPQTALEGTTPYSTRFPSVSFTYFTSNPAYLHDVFHCQLKLLDISTGLYSRCVNNTYFCSWSTCGGTNAYQNTISGLKVKGIYQFSVRAVDKAGNIDATPIQTTFKYDPVPPNITLTGVLPSKFASIDDAMTFSFAADEGTTFVCYFTRSDDPTNVRRTNICFSPVSFAPPVAARRMNGSRVNFTIVGSDRFTGQSRTFTYITTLYNTTSLPQRVANADARTEPIVCTNNDQLYFILFIVFIVLFIATVIIFPVLILRKMENKGIGKASSSSASRKESRVPLTSFSNPEFKQLD